MEFFHHPGHDGQTLVELPARTLRRRRLEPQTRVFFKNGARWHAGRILEARDDAAEVGVGGRSVLVAYDDLHVISERYSTDPAPFLVAGLAEPRSLSLLRRHFVQEAVVQRAIGAGLEGLLSASVELHPHQMNVVRRVLTDPVQRYLLADEVGLGKTVEAAAIIRQHVIDDPAGHKVVVVVPEPLVGQWRDELSRRFHLGPPLLDDSILVLHAGDEDLEDALDGARLVVVDEAHRLVGRSKEGRTAMRSLERLRQACREAPCLLLLSATPAIADEDSFFELMQLIDPEIYTSSEREAFHQRISHRELLAQIIAGFEPEALGLLAEDGERLREMFPADERLGELLDELDPVARAATDSEQQELKDAVNAVRQHLSETYRLHRRILRNRRAHVRGLTPPRSGAQVIEFADSTAGQISRALENWRLQTLESVASDPTLESLYADWLRLLLEAPARLASSVRQRLSLLAQREDAAESQALLRLLQHLDAWDPIQVRLQALLPVVDARGHATAKFVIFCTDADVGEQCFSLLRARYGPVVARHSPDVEADSDRAPEWTRFLKSDDCRILVCDATAEEGLNLQGGRKVLVHLDMPFAPNRIEQRLGRVDRFGSGDPVVSVVLNCSDNEVEQAWIRCVVEGFGVTQRSIASLQYLVDAEMAALRASLAQEGLHAIASLTARLGGPRGAVAGELRRIDQQDKLEELQGGDASDFEDLEGIDDDWRRIRSAVEPWIVRGLRFQRSLDQDEPPGIDQGVRYRLAGEGWHGTQIPVGWFRSRFLGVIDTGVARANVARPATFRYAYRRATAVNRETHLMRGGDALFAGLLRMAGQDDRGRVDAVWRQRQRPSLRPGDIEIYFRCDMLVEADPDPAMALFAEDSESATRRRAIGRRLDMVFGPQYMTVWVDRGLQMVDPEFVGEWLDPPDERDLDLGPKDLQSLRHGLAVEVMQGWSDLVPQVAAAASTFVRHDAGIRDRSTAADSRLQMQGATHMARLESRLASLQGRERQLELGRLALEQALSKALREGVRRPRVKLDAIGVVFLGQGPLGAGA